MNDCIFCKIIKGEIPSYKIYEDEKVVALLDINPLSKGHTLVLPKEHYESVIDIPEDLYAYMFRVVKRVSNKIKEKYNPDGILVNQNNGSKAGQSIFHAHVHIKPIYDGTPVFEESVHRKDFSKEEINACAKDLRINQ